MYVTGSLEQSEVCRDERGHRRALAVLNLTRWSRTQEYPCIQNTAGPQQRLDGTRPSFVPDVGAGATIDRGGSSNVRLHTESHSIWVLTCIAFRRPGAC